MAGTAGVGDVMARVARADFLPAEQRPYAGRDGPLPIGAGQTCSQPRTVAAMLELLDVRAGHRVLDVGAGSGWTTSLLAELVGPTGLVVGVELEPQLAARAAEAVARRGTPWATVEVAAHGVLGAPDRAPYDRVLVSAEADDVPTALVGQLRPGGLMVCPVRRTMLTVRRARDGDGPPAVAEHGSYAFVPLR